MKEGLQSSIKAPLWTKDFCLICLTNLFLFAGFQMLMPTLPLYVEMLGGGRVAVGAVGGIFAISAIIVRPIAGKLLDQGGRKKIFVMGLIVCLIAIFGYPWASGLVILIIVRLIHGVGFGMATTSAGTIASDLIPSNRLGEGMGYYGLTNTFSMAIAPAMGLLLLYYTNFTTLFIVAAVFSIFALLTSFSITCPEFERAETTKSYKYLEPAAFLPSIVMLFTVLPFGAIVSFISLYAIEQGIENIGFFFTVYAMALAVTRPLSGTLSDRHGYHKVIVPGSFSMATAMYVMSIANNHYLFAIAAIMFGLGIGLVMPSMQALTIRNVAPNRRGAANGTFFSAFDIGMGLGSLIWGVVAHFYGYSIMYMITIIPVLIGLAIFLRYYKKT
ncbi:MAG: hypothetical protein APF76_06920 [Desulfitibacter sp. BRH_c19]|nr:MAG: hypothetical protein APF76_06920 [Desulfitibacter sp. BRH_c19]